VQRSELGAEAADLGLELDAGLHGLDARLHRVTPRGDELVLQGQEDVLLGEKPLLEQRRDALIIAGIPLDRICLDPGIGFGKTHAHNLELMARAGEFLDLGVPILVGHSRKGFIGKSLEQALGRPATLEERDGGTAGSSCGLAAAGIQIVRVHAVGLVRSALELYCATAAGNA